MQVEERPVSVDELLDADEVFCTGTAVVVSPVGSITYLGKRYNYILILRFYFLLLFVRWLIFSCSWN